MKKKTMFLQLFLVFLLLGGFMNHAQALPFTFVGNTDGGTGMAMMDFSFLDKTLTVDIYNTSPVNLDGGISGGNSPGITGFGFNIDPADITLSSWTLKAYSEYTQTNLITIGSDVGGPYEWDMGNKIGGISLDYMPNSYGSISGALFNSDAFGDPNNTIPGGSNTVYYTKATLTMVFDQSPSLNLDDFYSPFVRMQNVGLGGEGSLKIGGTSPVPEPATMMLFGIGLLGLAGVSRRMKQ